MNAHEIALRSLAEIDARLENWNKFKYPHPASCNCSPCIHERRMAQTEREVAEWRTALHEITERDWEAPEDKRAGPRTLFMAFTLGAAVVLALIVACIYWSAR